MLLVFETHPVQYHAPLFRALNTKNGLEVAVVYDNSGSVTGSLDPEFGRVIAWDVDLLSGYRSAFVSDYAGDLYQAVNAAAERRSPSAALILGYARPFEQRALWWAVRRGIPILFRAETTDVSTKRDRLSAMLRDALLRQLYRRCASLLYIGEYSREHYRRLGVPESKLIFSPYCVDTSYFATSIDAIRTARADVRRELHIPDQAAIVLFSGKVIQKKDPMALLRAFLHLDRPNVHLVFVGEGALLPELKDAANSAGGSAHFVGFRNQTELGRYYGAADAVVLPSRVGETWGLVVNEALHHGVPVVVSDRVGCWPDLVRNGETGFVFRAGDDESLLDALGRCLDLAANAATRERCMSHIATYSLDRAADGVVRAYDSVMEQ